MKLELSLALSLAFAAARAFAEDDAVAAQLKEQEQRIKVLERKLELQDEASASAATSNAVVKASPSGFTLQSADGKNSFKLRGNFQLDGRWFSDRITPTTANTWLLRRVRPYVEGTVNGNYDFRLMPDFAGGKAIILDAYVAARLQPWAVVQAGKFKGPVGLERLQPDQYTRFIELGLPSSLVPNRDIGLQFSGTAFKGTVNYAVGYFDGTIDGVSTDSNAPTNDVDNDGKKDVEARIFLQPFLNSDNFYLRGLGIGIGGSTVNSAGSVTNTLLPGSRTPGQQALFSYRANTATGIAPNNAVYADGDRTRVSPQAYYYVGSLGVIGEYTRVSQDVSRQISAAVTNSATLRHSAWQVSVAYFLTGEEAAYGSFTPGNNFSIGKPGWGAWEVALRYQRLNIDDDTFANGANSFADPATQPSAARAIGVGLNWYLNLNVKWQLNYERTQFTGGAASGADRDQENAIFTRFALVF
jgi:phosphate-selective porin OprO/OprP